MVNLRQNAFNNISRILAVTRYDIEQRQLINDYGLNIHSENYFRDVFNFIYKFNFENANFESQNVSCIDLIDRKKKLAYQITTTRTKEKIEKTLKILTKAEYNGYTIKIFYLLDKSKPSEETVKYFADLYKINLIDCLLDYTNLIKDINNLETQRLLELNTKYFKEIETKYTDVMILDLVFKHLVQNKEKITPNFDDDYGTIETNKKLQLNNLNARITNKINDGLDYIEILNNIEKEDNILEDLRSFVVTYLYKNILTKLLKSKVSKTELEDKTLFELHNLSKSHKLDFNKIINNLHIELKNNIIIDDFNATSISWIIIAFFFEICDVGVK